LTHEPTPTGRKRSQVRSLLVSIRPRQWIKNLLVFAALVFAERFGDPEAIADSILAFAAFCLLSGAVYLVNDLLDRERDRLHPRKRERPIAAGHLGAAPAVIASSILALGGLAIAASTGTGLLPVAGIFLAINLAYSLLGKHVGIVDVLTVAIGFVLRAAAGGVAIDVRVSPWLLVCTFFLALFLAIGKRRCEIEVLGEEATRHRRALGRLEIEFLDQLMTIVTPAAILSYALYTISADQPREMVYTVPFVVYGIFRYLWLVRVRGEGDDPSEVFLRDLPLQADLVLWLGAVAAILLLF
jgi:4-hydroxybenzoate polyprenyltransferase